MELRFADCVLDTAKHRLTRSGAPVDVEPQVFALLRLLAERQGDLVTRDEMVDAVWGGRFVSESTISARISAARRAVGDTGRAQAIIHTVVSRGVQLVVPVTRVDTARRSTAPPSPMRRPHRSAPACVSPPRPTGPGWPGPPRAKGRCWCAAAIGSPISSSTGTTRSGSRCSPVSAPGGG